jgi:TRAP-type C4-dicarboxylate transport system permease small subunit
MFDHVFEKLDRFDDILEKIINIIIIPLYVNLIAVVFIQVFFRYVIQKPFSAANELALYSFVWIVYLTAALSVRKKTHFNIEILEKYLEGKKVERFYKMIVTLLMLVVALVLTFYGTRAAILGIDRLSPGSDLPLIYTVISVPICGVLMTFFLVVDFLKLCKR